MSGRTQSVYVWGVAAFLSLCGTLCADVITMKDGKRIECKIIAEMDEYVEVQVKRYGISTTHKYPLTQIKSIEKGDVAPESSEGEAPAKKPDEPAKAEKPEKAEKTETTPAEPAKKSTDEKPAKEAEAAPAVEDQRPIEFDLRLGMFEPLIYDTFEDGPNKIEPPKRRGYFVLLPFHYGCLEGQYVVALRTYTLSTDQGTVRCRGFVPLEARATGTARPAGAPKGDEDNSDAEDAPVQLNRVKGSPLYERMVVYQEGDQPMVSYVDQSRGATTPGAPKTPAYNRPAEPVKRRGGPSASPPQAEGERPVRGYERGREKESSKPEPASGKGKQGSAPPAKAPAVERTVRDRSIPSDGKPASQWAAMLLEVSNDASIIYVHTGSQKVAIELRLLDVMGQGFTGGAKENTPEELKVLAGVAEYILSEGPALSRLAVHYFARLHEGLKNAQRPQPTPGAQGEGELDKRTRIIERSLLAALVQKDERTGRIAWRAITSGDTLPKVTEMAIAELDRPQALKAILREVEKNIKRDATLASTAVGGPGGGRPNLPLRAGTPGMASLESLVALLPDGSGTPATWALLGALMRSTDAQVGSDAVKLAMSIPSKQAAMALGQPSVVVAGRMMGVLAKTPPSPQRGLALRLAMCGVQGSKDKQGIEGVLAACAGVAQQMAAAGAPIVVMDPADVLMAAPLALRENPDWQVRAMAILQFCRIGIALEAQGIDKWLTGMTDKLMAQGVRDAAYVLVAEKWEPSYLPPLSSPRQTETQAGGQPGAPGIGGALAGRGVQGGIEKFLVDGMASVSGDAKVFIIASLLRGGRADLVMGQVEKAEPPALVGLLKVIQKLTANLPPSVIPGEPSRFVPLSLAMGLLSRQKEATVTSQVATVFDEMSSSASGDAAWRLGFMFKRTMQWEPLVDLSAGTDAKAAGTTRTALGRILSLAAGEATALASLKDRASVMAKLDDYDNQRAAKLPGKYHLMVFCDLMVPSYSLEFDPTADSRAKEREVKIANLRWDRRVIGLEPGIAEIRTAQERKLDVILGAVPIGSGVAATAKDVKAVQTKPAAPAATPAKPSAVDLVEALKRRQGAPSTPGTPPPSGAEPPAGTLEIRLPMLVGALLTVPAVKQQFPAMDLSNPSDLVKVFPPPPPKTPGETKEPSDPFTISMSHLAFGTRQGSVRFGESSPSSYERLIVNEQNKPIRGQPLPMMKEIQVFLEPVQASGSGK